MRLGLSWVERVGQGIGKAGWDQDGEPVAPLDLGLAIGSEGFRSSPDRDDQG